MVTENDSKHTLANANELLKNRGLLLSFSPVHFEKAYLNYRAKTNTGLIKYFLTFGSIIFVLILVLFWSKLISDTADSTLLKINFFISFICLSIGSVLFFLCRNREFIQQCIIWITSLIFLSWKCFYPYLIEDVVYSMNSLYLSISYLVVSGFFTKIRASFALTLFSSVALITYIGIISQQTSSHLTTLDYLYATAITCFIAFFVAIYQDNIDRRYYLNSLIQKTQQKELENLNQSYVRLSREDHLTGLANRRYLQERLENEWQRAKRFSGALSIIMFDIDNFKQYNDHYGHLAGDSCLKEVAICITSVIQRPTDLAARYGGEEFLVVLPETDQNGAAKVANTIKHAIKRHAIENIVSNVKPIITASFGIATLYPGKNDNHTTNKLIKLADDALYQAKTQGKDMIVIAKKNSAIVSLINKAQNDLDTH